MQPIIYRTRPVALAAADRFWLTDDIDALPAGHPIKTWACFMCLYARDVLTGQLPGPYSHATAELFARAALMAEDDFLPLGRLSDQQLAGRFNVPLEQVRERRLDLSNPTRRP